MKTNNAYQNARIARPLPRPLVGLGGRRFYNIPGVIYPKEVLTLKPGHDPKTGRAYTKAPDWAISTVAAARLMHCTAAAARLRLHRLRTRYCVVHPKGEPQQLYWSRRQVKRWVARALPIAQESSEGTYITTAEAMKQLGVTRTSLSRYVERGLLHVQKRRIPTDCGLRTSMMFLATEIDQLAAARKAWVAHGDPKQALRDFFPQGEA